MKIQLNQIFEGKDWSKYTHKNHLINAFAHDPIQIANKLEQITKVDLGEDFVSMVMGYGTHYLDSNKDVMQWFLENAIEENYELIGAYTDAAMTSAVASGTNYCKQGSSVYLVYENDPFSTTEHLEGEKPDLYTLRVNGNGVNVGGNRFRYEVTLVNANRVADGIPGDELLPGTRWSSAGGSIPDDRSYEGFDISFKTNGMLETRLGRFRMQHSVGRAKDIKPLSFFVTNRKTGKPVEVWMSNIEYEFYRKARWSTASLIVNGKTSVKEDGTIVLVDKNGEGITTGSGFKEQWSATNFHLWSVRPSLDRLVEIAMSVSVGKIPLNQRRYIVKAGEWGLMELGKMVQRTLGSSAYTSLSHLGDTTGRAYKWGVDKNDPNSLYAKLGQFMGVATINGIEFWFMIDPSKDDPRRNKTRHPLGGLASSYEYDIFLKDAKEIMQVVRRKGERPEFYVEEGPRGWFSGGVDFKNPARISSAVEGATIHYIEPGVGGVVWQPLNVVRYYPTQTWSY